MGRSVKDIRKKHLARKKTNTLTAKKYYTQEEVKVILETIQLVKKKRPDVYCFLMLIVYTASRRNEILVLRKDQIHKNQMVTVEGAKGSLDGTFSIPDKEFFDYLYSYAQSCDEYLFDFHPETATRYMKKMMPPSCKIQRPLHGLRHTIAVELYRKSKDLKLVQKFLRHKDIKNSAVYADAVDLQEVDAWDVLKGLAG